MQWGTVEWVDLVAVLAALLQSLAAFSLRHLHFALQFYSSKLPRSSCTLHPTLQFYTAVLCTSLVVGRHLRSSLVLQLRLISGLLRATVTFL